MLINERIEIEDQFLTSKPLNKPHPRNEPWTYYLFAWRAKDFRARIKGKTRQWTTRSRYLHTISGHTKRHVDMQLKHLMMRKNVSLAEPGKEAT